MFIKRSLPSELLIATTMMPKECIFGLFCFVISCHSNQVLQLPRLQLVQVEVHNNSYIYYAKISSDEGYGLRCVTDNKSCCNGSDVGNWIDLTGSQQGVEDKCLHVERVYVKSTMLGNINLNRKDNCTPSTSGIWRCDIPDSGGKIQSFYVYISNSTVLGTFYCIQEELCCNTSLPQDP